MVSIQFQSVGYNTFRSRVPRIRIIIMLKLLVVLCALVVLGSAYPAENLSQSVEGRVPGPVDDLEAGQGSSASVADEPVKEDLERSETFGFGYKHYYPRYYGYSSYYHYPRYYYSHYPRYYYW
ncbi:uncharacterized protein LOC131439246 [Malaya genurostris]|uniref:uncharacterized protein LOC131439246 n=1 Tax=Malaya genurostris TaxID=325434 RepID=UPI0026F380E2|nr:uncharacterized protein LOC131439246 [Malaya genurostris]